MTGSRSDGSDGGWYYNVITKQVEQRGEGKGTDQLGPYPTREAAEQAIETVRAREEELNRQDREWRGDA
jgi:hypothetical protein